MFGDAACDTVKYCSLYRRLHRAYDNFSGNSRILGGLLRPQGQIALFPLHDSG